MHDEVTTWRTVLLVLVVAISIGAGSSLAATSTCLTVDPSANGKACGAAKTAPATVVTMLPVDALQPGSYRLWITTAKPGGLTRLVRWSPPDNLAISAITGIDNGRCSLAGGRIACVAARPGRSIGVTFVADVVRPSFDSRNAAPVALDYLNARTGLFRLTATNTGEDRVFIHTFDWHPPQWMTLTAITLVEGGKCKLETGDIRCRASKLGIRPPLCTCLPGGSLTVDFYAADRRPPRAAVVLPTGVLNITSSTPVPVQYGGHFLPQFVDLPICGSVDHPGKASTPASPCSNL